MPATSAGMTEECVTGPSTLRDDGSPRIRLDTPTPRFVNRTLLALMHDGRAHSSAGERSLHTGEVQGSIPCAPTSLRSRCELRLGRPSRFIQASEGCRAEPWLR